ncbi:hypothetical protein PENTCL1PPCAC_20962, partial [Pristionchus entomophagus]
FRMLRTALLLISVFAVGLSILCPNPDYSCPETSTCCLLADDVPPGEYGCCPMPLATCCEDHLHCCPSGQSCDVEQGTCTAANGAITKFASKFRARKTNDPNWEHHRERELITVSEEKEIRERIRARLNRDEKLIDVSGDIVCPDGKERCPALTTCCQLEGGQYGCCPAPNAVCCQDHMHCCPDGYRCDGSSERCKPASSRHHSIPWLRKFPTTKNIVKEALAGREAKSRSTDAEKLRRPVDCGMEMGCRVGHTCCQSSSDDDEISSVCCPMEDAVCCSGGCCKAGWSCSRDGFSCEKAALTEEQQYVRMLKKGWTHHEN